MLSYQSEIRNSWVRGTPSIRELGGLLGIRGPLSLKTMVGRLRQVETVTVSSDIHTDGTVLNGHVAFELRSDGSYTFSGHVRATGLKSYHYAIQAWVSSPDGNRVAAQRSGRAFGSDTPGKRRQDDWSEAGNSPGVHQNWQSLRSDSSIGFHMNTEISGVLGALGDLVTFGLKAIAINLVVGPLGVAVLIGSELGDAGVNIGTPDVLAGVFVAGGALLVLGPSVLIPAVVAGIAAAQLTDVKHRSMRIEEIEFAKRVFMETIAYDKVRITNMTRPNSTKFTIPSVGGIILVNMGDEAYEFPARYADPKSPDYAQPGSVFIHELTHAWQITNMSFAGLVCGRSSDYDYHLDPLDEAKRLQDRSWAAKSWHDDFNNDPREPASGAFAMRPSGWRPVVRS